MTDQLRMSRRGFLGATMAAAGTAALTLSNADAFASANGKTSPLVVHDWSYYQKDFTGFKAYFIAELTATTTLDISGDDIERGETSDSWKHAYLPIEHPIEVRAGDRLEVAFSRRYPEGGWPFRQVYRWQGRVERAGQIIGSFDQGMEETRPV